MPLILCFLCCCSEKKLESGKFKGRNGNVFLESAQRLLGYRKRREAARKISMF